MFIEDLKEGASYGMWLILFGVQAYRLTYNSRMLEVGALKPDNYEPCSTWIDWTPMDLHSRHPRIIEQDFLTMSAQDHIDNWDAISLSLVLNFVPSPADRGMQFFHYTSFE